LSILNSIDLKEQKASLIVESRKLLDKATKENRELNAEEEAEWEKRMKDVDAFDAQIRSAERKEKMEAVEASTRAVEPRKSSASQPTRSISQADRNKAFKHWAGYGSGANLRYDGDTMQRCAEMGMSVTNNCITRSMNTSTAGAGGNSTFTTTYPELQTEMKYFSPILSKVTMLPTDNGNSFIMPRASDVANTMAIVAQSGAAGTTTDPTFDKVTLGAYNYRYIELVSYEMLQDAVFDVEGWLTTRLAERAARTMEAAIVNGEGTTAPTGLVTACTTSDAGTPAITLAATKKSFYQFTDLMTLFAAVDLAYRPNATLVLHDTSVWDLRRIVDSQGRYIWDVNNTLVQNSQPDKVAGFNYLVSNSVDASNAFSKNLAIFADLSRYIVRMVDGIQITRLNELYRATGCIGFEIQMRFDGNYIGHASSIARARTPVS
jgi:HK97 family phage major capsid protein